MLDFLRSLRKQGMETEYLFLTYGRKPWQILSRPLHQATRLIRIHFFHVGSVACSLSLPMWLGKGFWKPYVHPGKLTSKESDFILKHYRRFRPQVVIADYDWMADIFDILPDKEFLKVIFIHDLSYKTAQVNKELGIRSENGWNEEREASLLKKGDLLLALQEEEAKEIRSLAPGRETVCISLSAPLHDMAKSRQISGRCLYVASGASENVKLLRDFLTHSWPLVLRQTPHATLHVCGRVADSFSTPIPNVRFLGFVQDLQKEYETAEVCVVPHNNPGGIKIKLIEALSHGRASVITSAGAVGSPGIGEKAATIADTPSSFAGAICEILSNREKRQTMEQHARDYVQTELTPEKAYGAFFNALERFFSQNPSLIEGRR